MRRALKRTRDTLGDFTRDVRIILLSAMAIVIGALSAFVATGLVWLINLMTNLAFYQQFTSTFSSPANHHLGVLVIAVPVIGGLVVGVIARFGSEKIRGHGIPEALEAILFGRSRMELKVALLKPLSSAISIGTGGPFGAEGPIILTCGAFGSLFAQLFHLSSAERKTILVAGAAAGMSAIFATPIAAVLLAVELLLFEWKPRSFIPVAVAAAVAGSLRVYLLGQGPIFLISSHPPMGSEGLVAALVAGIIAGLGSSALTRLVYAFEDMFTALPIHWMWWPALGGLGVGIGGLIDPRIFGVGYDVIHALLQGEVIGTALMGLLIGKALIWSFALGSGTSGGVLAPLLMIGGALGALEAPWFPGGDTGLWALISMAAVMGGTMRSPLTAIVFALELTHDVNVLPGLLVSCIAAHAVTVLLMRRSILTEKVARRGYHVVREYSVDPLDILRVGDVMDTQVQSIPPTMKLAELSDRIARGDPDVTRHNGIPIIDDGGNLAGIITRGDVMRGLDLNGEVNVIDAGVRDPLVTYPDEILHAAVEKMLTYDVGRLPVVDRQHPQTVVGYLGRPAILASRLHRIHEEHVREPGWLGRSSRHARPKKVE